MSEKRKYTGKTIAEKLQIIREVDKKERSQERNFTGLWNPSLHTVDLFEKSGFH
jgi:hypothetical protein